MSDTALKIVDVGLRAACYLKFGDILDLGGTTAEPSIATMADSDTIETIKTTKASYINTGVLNYPDGVALREIAEKRGENSLEFINVWCTSIAPDLSRQRTPAARRGVNLAYTDSNQNKVVNVKAQPVTLEYDVTFWSLDKEKINQIAERYIFWPQTLPNLVLLLNDTYPLKYFLKFGSLIDKSTVDRKYEVGKYIVYTAPITVEGWVYKLDEAPLVNTIILTCFDQDSVENYSEIIVADSNQDTELAATLKLFTATTTEAGTVIS